jgi:hypothetical protein
MKTKEFGTINQWELFETECEFDVNLRRRGKQEPMMKKLWDSGFRSPTALKFLTYEEFRQITGWQISYKNFIGFKWEYNGRLITMFNRHYKIFK